METGRLRCGRMLRDVHASSRPIGSSEPKSTKKTGSGVVGGRNTFHCNHPTATVPGTDEIPRWTPPSNWHATRPHSASGCRTGARCAPAAEWMTTVVHPPPARAAHMHSMTARVPASMRVIIEQPPAARLRRNHGFTIDTAAARVQCCDISARNERAAHASVSARRCESGPFSP